MPGRLYVSRREYSEQLVGAASTLNLLQHFCNLNLRSDKQSAVLYWCQGKNGLWIGRSRPGGLTIIHLFYAVWHGYCHSLISSYHLHTPHPGPTTIHAVRVTFWESFFLFVVASFPFAISIWTLICLVLSLFCGKYAVSSVSVATLYCIPWCSCTTRYITVSYTHLTLPTILLV